MLRLPRTLLASTRVSLEGVDRHDVFAVGAGELVGAVVARDEVEVLDVGGLDGRA